ncbi:hypothetical protein [Pseudodesulfovibrio sp. zrk46]|uniref:hypothetical protein n=1 Tax=Pseudodesulfovibrio sp. zrk46 TaxID=2725288 RepID=UPI0014491C92|nr:hypothetical protein [Pseudodesulfovibrio sp. zrk46]QJB57756.1 hypothetical protein HFN16_15685 [Pseudodesulfovibrio sp. zrk46]
MSDFSISAMTMSSMASENQAASFENSVDIASSTIMSGINQEGADSQENAVAGAEVASRTTEFFGNGTDLGSTGTDIDVAQAISSTLLEGTGTITDKVV